MVSNWYVYIVLCSKNNSYYTGSTTDVTRRITQHNSGAGAKYCRSFGPVSLLYFEIIKDRSSACSREHQIKSLSRTEKEQLIKSTQNLYNR